jgi:hypothetical protein
MVSKAISGAVAANPLTLWSVYSSILQPASTHLKSLYSCVIIPPASLIASFVFSRIYSGTPSWNVMTTDFCGNLRAVARATRAKMAKSNRAMRDAMIGFLARSADGERGGAAGVTVYLLLFLFVAGLCCFCVAA